MQEVKTETRKTQRDLPLEGAQGPGDLGFAPTGAERRPVAAQRPDEVYGYTLLPDGTRHEFVIEGWEEYIRDEDTPEPISFFDCEKSSN